MSKTRKLLPKLRKIVNKNRKHTYKLKDPQKKRILAINEKIAFEAKKMGKTTKKAAIAKKGRFNILRIYRRNKKIDECKKITKDMRYIDKKYKLGKTRDICGQKGGDPEKSIINEELKVCSTVPLTGFTRDGFCKTNEEDSGNHLVCAEMDKDFLEFTKSKGNDLSSVVEVGDKWCLCQNRWLEASNAGKAPKVIKEATNAKINDDVMNAINQEGGKSKKQQFLYNPNNPKKSFDVYIDKNPNDTIPIKYTTVKDVKNTIKKLEKLYKAGKYSHKRIWQVGMIMKVRLEAMKKHKKKLYPNAKNVTARFNLANKYFKFLSNRTKEKQQKDRKKMSFKYNMKGGRKTRKRKIKMKEKVVKFEKGPGKKKYTAHIKNISTRKVRKIHFGHKDYQQYRDSTNLKLYTRKNHGDIKRMRRYFSRHSGTKKRGEAIKKEKIKSNGFFNAKILSHIYLW